MAAIRLSVSRVIVPSGTPIGVRWLKKYKLKRPYRKQPSPFFSGTRTPGINDCPNNCLCTNPDVDISWKNPSLLSQFTSSSSGIVLNRRVTGVCEHKQKKISKCIKQARNFGLMAYYNKAPMYFSDPELFPPNLDDIDEDDMPT